MDRAGEFLTKREGAKHSVFVWCDENGSFSVDENVGSGAFYFNENGSACGGSAIYLRCEVWRA